MSNKPSNSKFHSQIVDLLQSARNKVARTINQTMVTTYFEIGRKIVEEEQNGKDRADYGEKVIEELSKVLTIEFGKGFSATNLKQMRQFYFVYSIGQTPSDEFKNKSQGGPANSQKAIHKTAAVDFKLSWSHYLKLMRIDEVNERKFYEIEAVKNNWSVRELQRQFDSALYTRLVLSRDKEKVKELSEKGLVFKKPKDAIKDPYVLEFIGLPEHTAYSVRPRSKTLSLTSFQINGLDLGCKRWFLTEYTLTADLRKLKN